MTEHRLKTWPDAFEEVWARRKAYELRRDDRGFELGDSLLLQEWDPATMKYSGRWIRADVTYVTRPGDFPGVEEGFCIMSLLLVGMGQASCVS
jgi:hypothetical protein